MSNAATTMYEGAVEAALELKAKTLWLCFAGTTTPWPNEQNPPTPAPGETSIPEPLVYIKATVKKICRPVSQAEWEGLDPEDRTPVPMNDIYYKYVDDADAYTEVGRWLYVHVPYNCTVYGHPAGTFRITRLLAELVPAPGYEGADWLLPANVSDRGKMKWGDNVPPQIMTVSNLIGAHIPLEFR